MTAGWIVLFANHTRDGSITRPGPQEHLVPSFIYWGGPGGLRAEKRTEIPGIGPHILMLRDLGNAYNRGLYEDYVSSPHKTPTGEVLARVWWEAETPRGTAVLLQIRCANTQEKLSGAVWQGPDAPDTWFTISGSSVRNAKGQWIQYRARLTTPNGAASPYLTAVTIEFATPQDHRGAP